MTHIHVAGGIYKPSKLTDAGDPRTATFQLVSGVKIQGGYAGGDYHLMPGSPCINAGNNAAAVVFADTTTTAGTQTSVIVADASRYAIDDEIEYDGDGVLRTVTGVDPDSGQVSFDDPLAGASEPNAPIGNYGWGDMDGDDRMVGHTVDMGADEYPGPFVWYVDDDAAGDPGAGDPTVSDPNEDGSAAHPFDAIQEGITAAINGDTVLVLDGTYIGVGKRDLNFAGRLITVRSANGAASCVIDCEGLGRAFTAGRPPRRWWRGSRSLTAAPTTAAGCATTTAARQ